MTGRGREAGFGGLCLEKKGIAIGGSFRGGPSPSILAMQRGGHFLCLQSLSFSYHLRDLIHAFLVLLCANSFRDLVVDR